LTEPGEAAKNDHFHGLAFWVIFRLRVLLEKSSIETFGEIRAGALEPRSKRQALTETAPPPDRMVGEAVAYVQVSPPGATKGPRARLTAGSKLPGHPEKSGWLVLFQSPTTETMKRSKFPTAKAHAAHCVMCAALLFSTPQAISAPGDIDQNFGTNGVAIVRMDNLSSTGQRHDRIEDLLIQTDGKIVAVGSTLGYNDYRSSAVARFNPDGTLSRVGSSRSQDSSE
jgi:hypothetical protein